MSSTNRQNNAGSTSTDNRFPSPKHATSTNTTARTSAQSTTASATSYPSNGQHPAAAATTTQPSYCPYHTPILQLQPTTTHGAGHDQTPFTRFLSEGPGEQSALHNRPDNGQSSLARDCTCWYGQHQQQQLQEFFDDVDATLGYGQQGWN